MDTSEVLPEHLPVLKINRTWVAAIKSNLGAEEPNTGMGHMNMNVGRILIGKMTLTVLHQAVIVLGGGVPFCHLEVFMVRSKVKRDVPLLNKIGKTPVISLRDRKSGQEQPSHRDQVPIRHPHRGITVHILKVRGWRVNFIEFPLRATLGVAPSLSFIH